MSDENIKLKKKKKKSYRYSHFLYYTPPVSISQANVLKVQHNGVNYYLSWYTRPSTDNSRLCLSATFSRTLNIKEDDEVFVSCVEEAPPLTSIVVAPKSSQDREIVVGIIIIQERIFFFISISRSNIILFRHFSVIAILFYTSLKT